MRHDPKSPSVVILTVLAGGLLLSGCGSFNMPSFGTGTSSDTPPPPGIGSGGAAMPSKYNSEEFVGRWGYTSYQKEADRARTINTARGLCRSPYVIAKGPGGGVMMHLADDRQPSELRLKGSPEGKNYIGRMATPASLRIAKSCHSMVGCWSRATSIPTLPTATATWSTCAARQKPKRVAPGRAHGHGDRTARTLAPARLSL